MGALLAKPIPKQPTYLTTNRQRVSSSDSLYMHPHLKAVCQRGKQESHVLLMPHNNGEFTQGGGHGGLPQGTCGPGLGFKARETGLK